MSLRNLLISTFTLKWAASPVCSAQSANPLPVFSRNGFRCETSMCNFQEIGNLTFSVNLQKEASSHMLVMKASKVSRQSGAKSLLKHALVTRSNFCRVSAMGAAVLSPKRRPRSLLALKKFLEFPPSSPEPW